MPMNIDCRIQKSGIFRSVANNRVRAKQALRRVSFVAEQKANRTKQVECTTTANTSKEWIKSMITGFDPDSRILALGDKDLLEIIKDKGLCNGLFVATEKETIAQYDQLFSASSLGNDLSLRLWRGKLDSVPAYQAPFKAALIAEEMSSKAELHETLLASTFLLAPGGQVVICQSKNGNLVKGESEIQQLIHDLPLQIADSSNIDIVNLQVPTGYSFPEAPIDIEETVVTGFGRGSKMMGVPTANLKPEDLFAGPLRDLPLGVYFGWAQLQDEERPDGSVHKTVLNIGKRPSVEEEGERTVELHIMHDFSEDFYGRRIRMVMLGFIRPEVKFPNLAALINRINADKGITKTQLDLPLHRDYLSKFVQ